MYLQTRTARLLHDDHDRLLAGLSRLGRFLTRQAGAAPAPGDDEAGAMLLDLEEMLGRHIDHHFAFEEELLLPVASAAGAFSLSAMLGGEHEGLRRLAARVRQVSGLLLQHRFDPEIWAVFVTVSSVLVERQTDHLRTEETALLGMVDALLSPRQDEELASIFAHSSGRGARR